MTKDEAIASMQRSRAAAGGCDLGEAPRSVRKENSVMTGRQRTCGPEPARDWAGGRLPGWPGPQSEAQAKDSPGCASAAPGATLMLWPAAWHRCAPQT